MIKSDGANGLCHFFCGFSNLQDKNNGKVEVDIKKYKKMKLNAVSNVYKGTAA